MNKRIRISIAAVITAFAAVLTVGTAGPADAASERQARPVVCC